MNPSPSYGPGFLAVLLLLLLSACGKVELYSQLDEQQGNEMLALLLANGISSEKNPGKDNVVSLMVDRARISDAIEVLSGHGLPRATFNTIDSIFTSDKLIYTPFEDRARYNYGLSQEIAKTLSQVDGVMAVRVHLVIPEEGSSSSGAATPASAAVFVKHNPEYDFEGYIPKIKSITAAGIPGLSFADTEVALFPARQPTGSHVGMCHTESLLGVELVNSSVNRFSIMAGGMAGLCLLLLVWVFYLLVSRAR